MCFEDEAGQSLRPPKGRTRGRRGHTPVVKVAHAGSGRVSLAGLVALKRGENPRLIYRTITYHGRKGEKKGFAEHDYPRLLDDAHQQLHAPVVLVRDNLNTRKSALMRRLIATRDWLTVFHLPSDAPEYNPVEGVWAPMKISIANLAKRTLTSLPPWSNPAYDESNPAPRSSTDSSPKPARTFNQQ
ncbi:MAG TPA: transposase [Actinocrinis sp.]|nr:transposase [Actinocrinis sp.]